MHLLGTVRKYALRNVPYTDTGRSRCHSSRIEIPQDHTNRLDSWRSGDLQNDPACIFHIATLKYQHFITYKTSEQDFFKQMSKKPEFS